MRSFLRFKFHDVIYCKYLETITLDILSKYVLYSFRNLNVTLKCKDSQTLWLPGLDNEFQVPSL